MNKKIDNSDYYITNTGKVLNLNLEEVNVEINESGYKYIMIDDKKNYIHRLVAYAFINNNDPEINKIVDHIDNDRQNNNYKNLRWCKQKDNAKNKKIKNKFNISGIYEKKNKYYVYIGNNGKSEYLGSFSDLNDAIEIRQAYESDYYKEFSPYYKVKHS